MSMPEMASLLELRLLYVVDRGSGITRVSMLLQRSIEQRIDRD
jgi:hypothetical protein